MLIIDKRQNASSLEADLGLKWFSRIGILALVIGIGFFIKYAIENHWLNYTTRLILGVVAGIALIIGGELVSKKDKYRRWGLTLVGGGFAVVYFVVYSAYHFIEYRNAIGISQAWDIILLSIVVLCAIFFSLKDNSRIIASEAFFLGYITSLLSRNFDLLTLIYGLILTFGLIAIVVYKKWAFIGIAGIIATYSVYLIWYFDNQNRFWLSTVFLLTYFIAYTLQAFLSKQNKRLNNDAYIIAITLINSLFFYVLSYLLIKNNYQDYDGLFTFLLGIFYLIAYYVSNLLKKDRLAITFLYLVILYITLAVPIQINKEWITIIWALEAVILIVLSSKLSINAIRYSSYFVGVATIFKTLFIDSYTLKPLDVADLVHSSRFFAFISSIMAFYFMAHYLKKNKKYINKQEYFFIDFYTYGGCIMTFILIFLEMKELLISVGWIILAAACLLLGFYLKQKQFRLQGIIVLGITILKVFLYDIRELDTLYRTISFIVLGVILLAASFAYSKYKNELKDIL